MSTCVDPRLTKWFAEYYNHAHATDVTQEPEFENSKHLALLLVEESGMLLPIPAGTGGTTVGIWCIPVLLVVHDRQPFVAAARLNARRLAVLVAIAYISLQ